MRLKRLAIAVASAVMLSGLAVAPAHATAGDYNPPQVNVKQGIKWSRGTTLSDSSPNPTATGIVKWTTYDPDGICSQSLSATDEWTGVTRTYTLSTTARTMTLPFVLGHDTEIWVEATDCSGNNNGYGENYAYFQPDLAQESAATYSAGWQTGSCACYSLNGVLKVKKAGATATYMFRGSSVAVIMPKSSTRGSMNVMVDGVRKATISLNGATSNRNIVWETSWTATAQHTVQLVSASAAQIDVDAFISAY